MFSYKTASNLNGNTPSIQIFSFGYYKSTIRAGKKEQIYSYKYLVRCSLFKLHILMVHITLAFVHTALSVRFQYTILNKKKSHSNYQRTMRCVAFFFSRHYFSSRCYSIKNFQRISSGTYTHLDINM